MKRTIPIILNDVGVSVGEQLNEAFQKTVTDPKVSRAMSILGKQSGEVRLEKAAEREMANSIIDNLYPEARMLLNKFAPDFLEQYGPEQLLGLIQKYGPYLSKFVGSRSLGSGQTEKYGEF